MFRSISQQLYGLMILETQVTPGHGTVGEVQGLSTQILHLNCPSATVEGGAARAPEKEE